MVEIESSILDAHWLDSEFQPEWPPQGWTRHNAPQANEHRVPGVRPR